MPLLPGTVGLAGLLFWAGQTMNALMPNATLAVAQTEGSAVWSLSGLGVPRYRRKRHISARDMNALLDYHNHIRASVHPPAANMEYMVSPRAFPGAPSGANTNSACPRWAGPFISLPSLASRAGEKGRNLSILQMRKLRPLYWSFLEAGAEGCNLWSIYCVPGSTPKPQGPPFSSKWELPPCSK